MHGDLSPLYARPSSHAISQIPGSSHYNKFMDGGFLNTNLTGGYGTPFGGCLGGTYVYDATSAAARNATFQARAARTS